MFQRFCEKVFGGLFRADLYGVEDRLAEIVKKYSEQYDFPEMFATLEEQIVKRVVSEMNKQSIRIVPSRKKVGTADVQPDTQPDEG